jgi:hypothetical protein
MILQSSGIFTRTSSNDSTNTIIIYTFLFGAALYGQGAGFHSASNMFKNALETSGATGTTDLLYYMRTVWEHEASHYLYASGYALMNLSQLLAFKDHKAGLMGLPMHSKLCLVLASAVFALLIAAVAIDFPSGVAVALAYLTLYGGAIVGGYTFAQWYNNKDNHIFVFGHRPILHYYLLSYSLSLALILVWVAVVGGMASRSQANAL